MTNMKKALIFTVFLVAAAVQGLQARGQKFTISGKIDGIVKGDTLRFRRITLPGWATGQAFDIVVKKDGKFKYRGVQEHDQFYLMEYFPAEGEAPVCDRMGKNLVISRGDRITMDGIRDEICYCTLGGGIYKDPALSVYLCASDSLDAVRGSYVRKIEEANAAGDHETAAMYGEKFNEFYDDNPGAERVRRLRKEYFDSSVPSLGIDDLKATLDGMLNHPWPDAELETGHPENRQVSDMFLISGWPFFIFIGPDGKILARDFSEAFGQAKKILEEKFGE